MPLTPEDVQAIGQLLDQRVAAHDQVILAQLEERLRAQERRRRRFWSWVIWLTILGSVLASIGSWWWLRHALTPYLGQLSAMQRQYQAVEGELAQTRAAFDQQLATDRQMQREWTKSVASSGYRSDQNQAQFDANLVGKMLALYNQSRQAQAAAAKSSGTPSEDEAAMEAVGSTMTDASTLIMQLLQHEMDPAHAGSVEQLSRQDAGSHGTAIAPVPPTPSKAAPTTGPARPATPAPTH